VGKAERVEAVQAGEEKAAGRPYCSLPVPERARKRAGEDFLQGHAVAGQGVVASG